MTARPASALAAEASIREVGPRDGLQPERPVSVPERVALIESLIDAGVRHVEVAAFVSPKAVPAMAGAAEVVAGVPPRPGLVRAALVPNAKGASLALEAGVEELTVTVSVSETYNQRNVRMSTAESEAVIGQIVELAAGTGVGVDVVVSCAFGSPYEGDVAPTEVAELATRLRAQGVDRLTFADTTGVATPRRIDALLDEVSDSDRDAGDVGLHLHDTRGTALVNAYAALQRGVCRFDTAVGGLGGSPFAHGAGGNLATETLVALLDDLGVRTGISIEPLIDAAAQISSLVDRPVQTGVGRHGPRTRRPQAS